MPTLIVIEGPTGSGKTKLAIRLAMELKCSIISADSRQVFRELKIGSAAPAAEELALVQHYFVGDRSVTDGFNAGQFASEAGNLLRKLFTERPVQIVCGGSGLYVNALIYGMDELPVSDARVRDNYAAILESDGIAALQSKLKELDPEYYRQVDLNNPQRLIRALEVITLSGKPYSELRQGKPQRNLPCELIRIQTDLSREELYNRISQRVDQMFSAGLEEEARSLHPFRHLNSLQTVGYRELFDYFEGGTTKEQAVELIKQHTRNYAKRQLTWLRKQPGIILVKPDTDAAELIEQLPLQFA